ncbi:hypothetical protein RGQ29_031391 [Quercus rubra]|uniref:FRIGIDA-like protein n=1 Tax=Quercus rubra TaxID=3512 RepID=A0AAN7EKI3_QUERU|nr:hypothetical protein RGQ29_031391 [Quercus rubra]
MEDSVVTLIDSTTTKIQQLQKAFAELESHRAITLNLKWKELEEHFHGLEKSLKRPRELLEKREAAVVAKEQASLERLQEKRDAAIFAIANAREKQRKVSSEESAVVTDEGQEDIKVSSGSGEAEVKSYPQLVTLCEDMDSKGLHTFISDNRFYHLEVPNLDGRRDSNLLGLRRTCIMLMECLSVLLTKPKDIKKQAKAIAEEWKPKLDVLDMDASNGNSLEAHAFLQLLATFGVASDFNEEELSRLIPMVSRRVIEVLVISGRQIDAVNLAFAFELTEQFSPVPLLKSYLKEARKASSPVKAGNTSPTAQNEVNDRELSALKAVLRCIEEHKLEEQYPVDPLQKRVLQLEKAKADKKRATEAAKPQPKRPRAKQFADRYPQYVYDRPYVYSGPADNHCPPIMGSATYTLSPSHGNYFGNGYQYQAPYLH